MNDDLKHFNFTYKKGLNVDTEPFNPTGECSKGGLYFCEESKCRFYFCHYGSKLALVEIPNDSRVYVEEDKFKADKLIIKKIINFCDVDDEFWINILPKKYMILEYIKNPTYELYKLAVQEEGLALKHVKNQTNELCMLAIQQDGMALQYVKNQTNEMCELAVQHNDSQNDSALQYVKNQTYEICIMAVRHNGLALKYVNEQFLSKELCIIAVQQDGYAIQYVINQNDDICILAVKQNGYTLRYVKNQTEKICILAVQQNYHAFEYVQEQFKTSELRELYEKMK